MSSLVLGGSQLQRGEGGGRRGNGRVGENATRHEGWRAVNRESSNASPRPNTDGRRAREKCGVTHSNRTKNRRFYCQPRWFVIPTKMVIRTSSHRLIPTVVVSAHCPWFAQRFCSLQKLWSHNHMEAYIPTTALHLTMLGRKAQPCRRLNKWKAHLGAGLLR